MKVAHSRNRVPIARDAKVAKVLREVSSENLRAIVEMLAFPRHYTREKRANRKARDLLLKHARSLGYAPSLQGRFDNIVMTTHPPKEGPYVLLGAHYDSVPDTPGADDNASAVAVCVECARLIKKHSLGPAMIVLFNREEDGLLGSSEFVCAPCTPARTRHQRGPYLRDGGLPRPDPRLAANAPGPTDPRCPRCRRFSGAACQQILQRHR
jgi:peptidase M28-like protein